MICIWCDNYRIPAPFNTMCDMCGGSGKVECTANDNGKHNFIERIKRNERNDWDAPTCNCGEVMSPNANWRREDKRATS
jgi:hypothetical protein